MTFYTRIVRPVLFSLDAETAHNLTIATLRQPLGRVGLRALPRPSADPRLRQRVVGLDFRNPIGLAAGLDKQGEAVGAWSALGFGFVEIGTVTPRAQAGNPRPRLFRLPADAAVVNRFGFNSDGSAAVARNLSAHRHEAVQVGINIGKNRDTPNDRAADDYVACVEALRGSGSYFVVNVSSPNTANLRDLQEARALRDLVSRVVAAAAGMPVLVKVSPDLPASELLHAVDAAAQGGVSGVVATNTTVRRDALRTTGPLASEAGGLSGRPLRKLATDSCRALFRQFGPALPIIGVGGIFSADDAYERIRAGASLVQVYTALIYEGPALVARLAEGLLERLERDNVGSISQVVGVDVR